MRASEKELTMDRRAHLNSNEVPVPFLLKLEVGEGGIIRHTKHTVCSAGLGCQKFACEYSISPPGLEPGALRIPDKLK